MIVNDMIAASHNLHRIGLDSHAREAFRTMKFYGVDVLGVVEEDKLVGLVELSDLAFALAEQNVTPEELSVRGVLCTGFKTRTLKLAVDKARHALDEKDVRFLVITNEIGVGCAVLREQDFEALEPALSHADN